MPLQNKTYYSELTKKNGNLKHGSDVYWLSILRALQKRLERR